MEMAAMTNLFFRKTTTLFVLVLCLCALVLPSAAAGWRSYPAVGASGDGLFTFVRGDNSLVLGSEGHVADFKGLYIAGHALAGELYGVSGEACTLTVRGDYLSAFEPGEYNVRILFSDGETNARLEIADPVVAPEQPAPEPAEQSEPAMLEGGAEAGVLNPTFTGMNTMLLGLLTLGGGGAALFGLGRKWMAQNDD